MSTVGLTARSLCMCSKCSLMFWRSPICLFVRFWVHILLPVSIEETALSYRIYERSDIAFAVCFDELPSCKMALFKNNYLNLIF